MSKEEKTPEIDLSDFMLSPRMQAKLDSDRAEYERIQQETFLAAQANRVPALISSRTKEEKA